MTNIIEGLTKGVKKGRVRVTLLFFNLKIIYHLSVFLVNILYIFYIYCYGISEYIYGQSVSFSYNKIKTSGDIREDLESHRIVDSIDDKT